MEATYAELKSRWLIGERERELALHLMYFAWMHWADPPFVTGLSEDPNAVPLWHETFSYLGGEGSTDAEVLYVSGIMAELFPWVLGDEAEWVKRGTYMQARAKELQPAGLPLTLFHDRGEYGEYFAHQLRGGPMQA